MFLIPILHQTTTAVYQSLRKRCCFSFQFYIKPQLTSILELDELSCFSFQFYIKPQQATSVCHKSSRCFSFQFYIKPQLVVDTDYLDMCCFSFQFYIKPQHITSGPYPYSVVSHSNSTSNHNRPSSLSVSSRLFLIPILHQTTTRKRTVLSC